jgi:enoyl-CoA hydratase/carnithine racemase
MITESSSAPAQDHAAPENTDTTASDTTASWHNPSRRQFFQPLAAGAVVAGALVAGAGQAAAAEPAKTQKPKALHIDKTGGVLRITKINKDTGYGISLGVIEEMTAALREARTDPKIRAVVIDSESGSHGGAVMVRELKPGGLADLNREDFRALVHRGHDLGRLIRDMPMVVIGVVRGGAVGGGLEMLLRSDLIYCTDNAEFRFPEVTLGFVAAWGGTQFGGRTMQYRKAQELLLLGQPMKGRQAEEYGLVTRSFPTDAALAQHVDEVLERLRFCAPQSVRGTKACLAAIWDGPLSHGEAVEVTAEENSMAATDFSKPRPTEWFPRG